MEDWHAPFSHGSEELFPPGLKHEHYTIAVIRRDFAPIIEKYFPDIKGQFSYVINPVILCAIR